MRTMTATSNQFFPTYEGIDKYPPTGFFDEYPCTCTDDCRLNCHGECGCKACEVSYKEYLELQKDI